MEKRIVSSASSGKRRQLPVSLLMIVLLALLFFVSGGHLLLKLRSTPQGGDLFAQSETSEDKLLGGLLSSRFDEYSCKSRYQSVKYRKPSRHLPSPYLVRRLREYEALHKKCGPNTELYKKSIDQLKSNRSTRVGDCSYLVWTRNNGLGNRMVTIASAFLYALLTNRVLLIDRGANMDALFCQPFPETSWLFDLDVPLSHLISIYQGSPQSYGSMLKDRRITRNFPDQAKESVPAFVLVYLAHDYEDYDQLFFCDEDQSFLREVPWLVVNSNNYFLPAFFLMQTYQEELSRLFPRKDTVFHHLGRYLFHPSNSAWGLITRYHRAHLSRVEKRVGIQIRLFDAHANAFLNIKINSTQQLIDQILACSAKEKLLPDLNLRESFVSRESERSIGILVASLSSDFFDKLKTMYWEHPTVTGETIVVHQPSHEEQQQTDRITHDMKALAEMYLLSLSDVLVTSSFSTFGYVAQGLGGLEAWMLSRPDNEKLVDPPCRRVVSMEPCFHATPWYDCKSRRKIDFGALVPYVTHCEDMIEGLKLVDRS